MSKKEDKITWIISEGNEPDEMSDGEFGVEVNGVAYFYYKWPYPGKIGKNIKYRPISKREFGEVISRDKIVNSSKT